MKVSVMRISKYKKKEKKRSENNDGKQMKMSIMRISNLKWF